MAFDHGWVPSLNAEYRSDAVPVIAVFTKFDDLVAQVYDRDREEESRTNAFKVVKESFETPLENSRDRPKAYVCLEGAFIYLLFQALPIESLFQPLMMTKVTIRSKWRDWLRKQPILLMTSPSRCYLSLSSKTTLNCASNMLYTGKVLLWRLTTETAIHFISDGMFLNLQTRYVRNWAYHWLILTFYWENCKVGGIMVQPLPL